MESKRKNLVSIIIPVLNSEKSIYECLDSVLNQSYSFLEIIIVYNDSSDATLEICNSYAKKDKRIRIIKNTGNKNIANSRNVGIMATRGEYIGFVDSDDYITKDMYEHLYKNISSCDADIAICGFEMVNEFGNIINHKNEIIEFPVAIKPEKIVLQDKIDILRCSLYEHNEDSRIASCVWNKLYRSSLFKNLKFIDNKFYEDIHITYLLLEQTDKVIILSERKYFYVYRKSSTGNAKNILLKKDLIEILILRYTYFSTRHPCLEKICRKRTIVSLIWEAVQIIKYNNDLEYRNLLYNIIIYLSSINTNDCDLSEDNLKMLYFLLNNLKMFKIASNIIKI
ncbi:MAG: glycosyltransferase [Defluviitaleaceae bacterium]|nr:glycosyltransferase [Defluviitaleaceae bacterium]